jgi:hypothetical protein
LANITWQDQRPFNLYNFQRNKIPFNLPYKIGNNLKRILHQKFGRNYSQRNWELQFLGEANEKKLKKYTIAEKMSALRIWVIFYKH